MKILIVCTGNSCRSQIAAAILKKAKPNWEILSAGTDPAETVNPFAVEVCREIGIDISKNTPKNVNIYFEDSFDIVLFVCKSANKNCPAFTGFSNIRMGMYFDDPYDAVGTDEEKLQVYRKTRDEIKTEFLKIKWLSESFH